MQSHPALNQGKYHLTDQSVLNMMVLLVISPPKSDSARLSLPVHHPGNHTGESIYLRT